MSKEAMKLALEALETERNNYQDWDEKDGAPEYIYDAITALREALAAPGQSFDTHSRTPQQKLVPYEPSIDMQEHGSIASGYDLSQARAKKVYQAMIDMHDVMMEREPTDEWFRLQAGYPEQPAQDDPDLQDKDPELVEQPAQHEPFTHYRHYDNGLQDWADEKTIPLYTSPPAQRTWVGLTDEEVGYIADEYATLQGALRAIEAKLKQRNT